MIASPRIATERGGLSAAQPQRNRADRADVGRDVLADHAVPARRPARENAVLVDELDREPVELRLDRVRDVVGAEPLLHAPVELPRVVEVHHRLEAEHRLDVADAREVVARRRADALRRRVLRHELRELRLERLELLEEAIVLGVGDLGFVEDVVEIIVARDFVAETPDPLFRSVPDHRL